MKGLTIWLGDSGNSFAVGDDMTYADFLKTYKPEGAKVQDSLCLLQGKSDDGRPIIFVSIDEEAHKGGAK